MRAIGILLACLPTWQAAAVSAGGAERELLDQARVAVRAGDGVRAAILARSALAGASAELRTSLTIHREAQDILLAAGQGGDLVSRYDRLLREDVSDPVRRYLRARVESDPERRMSGLEAVASTAPELFWAAYDLAEAYARAGRWERAVGSAEQAVKLRPAEAAAWNVLGHLRLEASRFLDDPAARRRGAEEARKALAEAVRLAPDLAEGRYNLGLVSFALGETDEARACFERAVAADPVFGAALNALGLTYARAGDADRAVELYKRAVAADPGLGCAHANLAAASLRRGEYARAQCHVALAEAAGYPVAASLKRLVVRALEEEAFGGFAKSLAGARRTDVRLFRPGEGEPVALSGAQRDGIVAAALKVRFRDSHGGARLGERRVRGTVVARYEEAARIEFVVSLSDGAASARTLLAVERISGSMRAPATWVVDSGMRFSAEAPELAALVFASLGNGTAAGRIPGN